jgi:hypothetical protein
MPQAFDKKPVPNRGSEPIPDEELNDGTRTPENKTKEQMVKEVTAPANAEEPVPQGLPESKEE